MRDELPPAILERRDKMGFPVPLKEWFSGELNDLVQDIFRQPRRPPARRIINTDAMLANFDKAGRFSRKIWGLLSLELWQQHFHDRAADYRRMMDEIEPIAAVHAASAMKHAIKQR